MNDVTLIYQDALGYDDISLLLFCSVMNDKENFIVWRGKYTGRNQVLLPNIYVVFIVLHRPEITCDHAAETKFLCLVFIGESGLLCVAFGRYYQATNTHELREAY